MIEIVNKCNIKPGYRFDHSSIHLDITVCKVQCGRCVWKFNCSLLKDKQYLVTITNLIDKEKLNYALPVYNPESVTQIPDSKINFTISDAKFLEILLLQI